MADALGPQLLGVYTTGSLALAGRSTSGPPLPSAEVDRLLDMVLDRLRSNAGGTSTG